MFIDRSLRATLTQLEKVLSELSDDEYGKPLPILSEASIGQHTRHIIEFFQALIDGYETGIINYDRRQRNKVLETDRSIALIVLASLVDKIYFEDKDVLLAGSYATDTTDEVIVRSTYYREVVYNLEHAIHHMAMIKVGIRASTKLVVPSDFGVAAATIQYKKSIL
jgi:hypothetical protein